MQIVPTMNPINIPDEARFEAANGDPILFFLDSVAGDFLHSSPLSSEVESFVRSTTFSSHASADSGRDGASLCGAVGLAISACQRAFLRVTSST